MKMPLVIGPNCPSLVVVVKVLAEVEEVAVDENRLEIDRDPGLPGHGLEMEEGQEMDGNGVEGQGVGAEIEVIVGIGDVAVESGDAEVGVEVEIGIEMNGNDREVVERGIENGVIDIAGAIIDAVIVLWAVLGRGPRCLIVTCCRQRETVWVEVIVGLLRRVWTIADDLEMVLGFDLQEKNEVVHLEDVRRVEGIINIWRLKRQIGCRQ